MLGLEVFLIKKKKNAETKAVLCGTNFSFFFFSFFVPGIELGGTQLLSHIPNPFFFFFF